MFIYKKKEKWLLIWHLFYQDDINLCQLHNSLAKHPY